MGKLADLIILSVNAVLSAKNYDEIKRYISKYQYKISDSKLVLRKILKPFSNP
jgi:hypothetical protein